MAEAKAPPPTVGPALAQAQTRCEPTLPLLRERGGHAAVSNLELFFDLVFVFAITQLSHYLLSHLTWLGAAQTAILFLAVWWAWMFTTWATNWIDPDHALNRLLLGLVMLAGLVMASTLNTAWTDDAWIFVTAYTILQIGRTAYTSFALGEWRSGDQSNLLRATLWFCAAAPLWFAGAASADPGMRMALWIAALAIEYLGPLAFFYVPKLGVSRPEDWEISGGHMAERCGLFIIIALGESLLITGATYAGAPDAPGVTAAFVNAFVGSFAMWWVYFDVGARRGAWHIEHHDAPGIVARQAFTYWHLPIVAGIILLAVADELALAHPLDPSHLDFVLVVAGGLALFIGGNMIFKSITSAAGFYPLSHGVGLGAAALLALWGVIFHPSHLALAVGATAVLLLVSLWEWGSFHGGWIERMEARGWWLGKRLRQRIERRRARRGAREAD